MKPVKSPCSQGLHSSGGKLASKIFTVVCPKMRKYPEEKYSRGWMSLKVAREQLERRLSAEEHLLNLQKTWVLSPPLVT